MLNIWQFILDSIVNSDLSLCILLLQDFIVFFCYFYHYYIYNYKHFNGWWKDVLYIIKTLTNYALICFHFGTQEKYHLAPIGKQMPFIYHIFCIFIKQKVELYLYSDVLNFDPFLLSVLVIF